MKKITVIVAVLLAIASCKEQGKKTDSEIFLSGQEFTVTDGDMFVNDFLAVTDSIFVFQSFDDRGNIKVYKKDGMTVSESYKFLRKGRGTQEINFINSRCFGDNLVAFDKLGGAGIDKMIRAEIDVESPKHITVDQIDWLNDVQTFGDFVRISDTSFIAIAGKWGEKELISVVDVKNRQRKPIDFWPDDNQEASIRSQQNLYSRNAHIGLNADKTKLVYGCGEGRYLDIMTLDGMNITGHNLVLDILPEYGFNGTNTVIKNKEYRGITIKTTADRIYVTYSNPVNDTDYKGFPWYFTDLVDTYDWDGNKVQRYVTDQPFFNFYVSPDDSEIYTLTQDNDTKETIIKMYCL